MTREKITKHEYRDEIIYKYSKLLVSVRFMFPEDGMLGKSVLDKVTIVEHSYVFFPLMSRCVDFYSHK
jgi:hypothetical protein